MSGKLDQSLEDILGSNRKAGVRGGRGARRGARPSKGRTVAPVGGVQKATKVPKKNVVPTGPAAKGDSKVIVSQLPTDVSETQIKDYFAKAIAPVKRVQITYGPNGQSRGIAMVTFFRSDAADKAMSQLNGVKVDQRPIKIEVVLDAQHAPAPAPAKALSERVTQPKAQPKPATDKKASAASSTRGRGRGRGVRGRNAGRPKPKPKTAAELDVEMDDYFVTSTGPAGVENAGANGAMDGAANGGDEGMDEIS
ncbi:MAG: hypothetical protein M1824_004762 [Vezdaea acicularis]|nr:MAG: hypothetical protein M1824_004762 [Vezdaea acicularis]